MAIGNYDIATNLAEDYLEGRGGSPGLFRSNVLGHQRLGQAFYNALSEKDRNRLIGTIHDPFYKLSPAAIDAAIEFLLDTE